jgi:hypothetical protein
MTSILRKMKHLKQLLLIAIVCCGDEQYIQIWQQVLMDIVRRKEVNLTTILQRKITDSTSQCSWVESPTSFIQCYEAEEVLRVIDIGHTPLAVAEAYAFPVFQSLKLGECVLS